MFQLCFQINGNYCVKNLYFQLFLKQIHGFLNKRLSICLIRVFYWHKQRVIFNKKFLKIYNIYYSSSNFLHLKICIVIYGLRPVSINRAFHFFKKFS